MRITRILVCFFLLSITGCAASNAEETSLLVVFSEPDRIQFQGKGAGAGIALMSTMGPVGIALGVAIDEGIAKDIRSSASAAGFDMPAMITAEIVRQNLSERVLIADELPTEQLDSMVSIEVKRYGFKTTAGENDATTAELTLLVSSPKRESFEFHFPDDIDVEETEELRRFPTTYPLSDIKADGALAIDLMQGAIANSLRGIRGELAN